MPEGAKGIFVNIDPDPVQASIILSKLRTKALEMMLEGKTIMSWGDGVTQTSKQFTMPPEQVLLEVKYAEERLNGRVRSLITNYNRQVDR